MYWLIALSYLLGGIPYCWLAVYYFAPRDEHGRRRDLREEGSGNVGASNAMRLLGYCWYVVLILADASKGFLSVSIAHEYGNQQSMLCAAFTVVFGHCFPVYLGFKRGKGLSTSLGILIALGLYKEAAWAVGIMLATMLVFKLPSLSSLLCAITADIAAMAYHEPSQTVVMIHCLVVLIFIRHIDNIKRLIKGDERKLTKTQLTDRSSIGT